jgi:hypothetical protein
LQVYYRLSLLSPLSCGRWFCLIYPGTEVPDFTDGLFYMAFPDVDSGNTSGTTPNLFEQRIDSFGAFFCTHITFQVPALIQLARYYYNPISAGLKRFDQVRNIYLSGTRQTYYLELMIF